MITRIAAAWIVVSSLLGAAVARAETAPTTDDVAVRCDARPAAVCDALGAALRADHDLPPGTAVHVRRLELPPDPALTGAYDVVSVEVPARARLHGHVTGRLTVQPRRGEARTVWLRAVLDVTAPTVVARRALARGAVVTAADVDVAMTPFTATDLRTPALAVGRATRRALRVGDPLRLDLLVLPDAVTRGQRVTAVVAGGRYAIRTAAEILRAGAVGDTVPVRIAASGKRLDARVLGPDLVEVVQ